MDIVRVVEAEFAIEVISQVVYIHTRTGLLMQLQCVGEVVDDAAGGGE